VQAVITVGALAKITVEKWKADSAVMARILVAGTW